MKTALDAEKNIQGIKIKQIVFVVCRMKDHWKITYKDKNSQRKAFAIFPRTSNMELIYSFLKSKTK